MALNLQGTNLQRRFYSSLTDTSNSLALSELWLVKIAEADFSSIFNEEIIPKFNFFEGKKWDFFVKGGQTFQPQWFVGGFYYLLARGCEFPSDGFGISKVGVEQTAMLKGPITNARDDLPNVTITFLETNQSVADFVLRPWALMVGHKSLKYLPLRKDIELVCLQKGGVENTLKVRKKFILEKAAPISVDLEEYNYTAGEVKLRQVKFVYNRYHILDGSEEGPINGSIGEVYKILAEAKGLDTRGFFDFLDPFLDILKISRQKYNNIRGVIDGIEADAVSILRDVGADSAAEEVEEEFRKLDKALEPLEETIKDIDRAGNVLETANQTVRDVSNFVDRLIPDKETPIEDGESIAKDIDAVENSNQETPLEDGEAIAQGIEAETNLDPEFVITTGEELEDNLDPEFFVTDGQEDLNLNEEIERDISQTDDNSNLIPNNQSFLDEAREANTLAQVVEQHLSSNNILDAMINSQIEPKLELHDNSVPFSPELELPNVNSGDIKPQTEAPLANRTAEASSPLSTSEPIIELHDVGEPDAALKVSQATDKINISQDSPRLPESKVKTSQDKPRLPDSKITTSQDKPRLPESDITIAQDKAGDEPIIEFQDLGPEEDD